VLTENNEPLGPDTFDLYSGQVVFVSTTAPATPQPEEGRLSHTAAPHIALASRARAHVLARSRTHVDRVQPWLSSRPRRSTNARSKY